MMAAPSLQDGIDQAGSREHRRPVPPHVGHVHRGAGRCPL